MSRLLALAALAAWLAGCDTAPMTADADSHAAAVARELGYHGPMDRNGRNEHDD
jgi:hypothetical protein